MSNILKQYRVAGEDKNVRVINSNSMIKQIFADSISRPADSYTGISSDAQSSLEKTKSLSPDTQESGFNDGINAAVVTEIDVSAEKERLLEEAKLEADSILDKAKAEASRLLDEAKQRAQILYADNKSKGYEDGLAECQREFDEKEISLRQELSDKESSLKSKYDAYSKELESDLIDAIIQVFNKVFAADSSDEILTESEKDAIGEIANISMGTAATTLFSLVNRRVEISTPVVSFSNWDKIVDEYEKPCVFIKIGYTQGLNGSNILVLKEKDVKIITDLMMGGDGTNINGEIGELHLSAISEAMNQMMGSSATSLSSMLNRTIDISPPIAEVVDLKNTLNEGEIDSFLSEEFVKISFHMEIGDLVDSEIMQLYPPAFVKEMCKGVSQNMELDTQSVTEDVPQSSNTATQAAPIQQPQDSGSMNNASANSQGMINENMMNSNMNSQNMMNQGMMNQNMGAQNMIGNQVNVQNAQFIPFGAMPNQVYQPENIDLIMDVPLEVTVELGRTKKSISEILDFGPGKIIELNKLAGEPIDILVNGKYVAKGEVVVIEESFGVRITEIVNSKINTGKTK